ncbi:MAG: D-alanyl-D-alanine carboxypeptidase/D-alanyl-D-alanine-endopeptidase [Thermoanaerobaculia bacterium]|nr:D-alanyl-D-alanine carboxypeptidase/D-alanyl-D-alanine-endopeptidase [Thermoanaerobaculia bacterium]
MPDTLSRYAWVLALLLIWATAAARPAVAVASGTRALTGCYSVASGPQGRTEIDAENADLRLTPASVAKLVTTMAALELLGPQFRVVTEVAAAGPVDGRTLSEDLVLIGAGDPTWSNRFEGDGPSPLESLAAQVAQRLDRVEGDLVLELSRFPGRDFPASRAVSEIAYAYGAPTGALALNDNVAWLRVAPGARVGDPAAVSWQGAPAYRIENLTITAPTSRHDRGTLDVLPAWRGDVLVLRGEYPVSEPPYRLPVALHDGERRVGEAFLQALAAAGVELTGTMRMSERPLVTGTRLATHRSPPISGWLVEILQDSDNWLSEMLLRQIALQTLGEGRGLDGAEHVVDELTQRAGLVEGSLELEDGSGLSPYDLVTPRAVVELLLWARNRPWWATLASSLPAPGEGTLAAWPGLPPSTRAKTGTLRHTVALAGLVERASRTIYFACFVNHATEDRGVLRRRLASRIASWR